MAVMVFSAEEIIGRAVQIEMNAMEFYKSAAMITGDTHARSVFEVLAGMEKGHARIFREIVECLTERERKTEVNDPGGEMLFYLDSFKKIQAKEAWPEALQGEDTVKILRAALTAEQETVSFYTFLSDYVPADRGLDKVKAVMEEERKHVAQLQNVLDRIEEVKQAP